MARPAGKYAPLARAALAATLFALTVSACSSSDKEATYGRGGSPPAAVDDPSTTNDESNDQPVGYFGDETVCVYSADSGNAYRLDASSAGDEVTIYFPRGGNVDFYGCELDDSFKGTCEDEEGREWEFMGVASGYCERPYDESQDYAYDEAAADAEEAEAEADAGENEYED